MSLIPGARRWIHLDTAALVARSPEEWRKAIALAKSFAMRWRRALGSETDDLTQEALHYLDTELRKGSPPGVPPGSILIRYFACHARNAARDRATRAQLLAQRAEELAPEPPTAADELFDSERLAVAFEAAVSIERTEGDGTDARILEGALLGLSLADIASSVKLGKTTVHRRLEKIQERIRDRILGEIGGESASCRRSRGEGS